MIETNLNFYYKFDNLKVNFKKMRVFKGLRNGLLKKSLVLTKNLNEFQELFQIQKPFLKGSIIYILIKFDLTLIKQYDKELQLITSFFFNF